MSSLTRWVWWDAFRSGPAWLGGWGGADDADVCATVTSTGAAHWVVNPAQCTEIIERRFNEFVAVQRPIIAVFLLYTVYTLLYELACLACLACTRRVRDGATHPTLVHVPAHCRCRPSTDTVDQAATIRQRPKQLDLRDSNDPVA